MSEEPTLPGDPEALFSDAVVHHRAQRLDLAEGQYRAALAAAPGHVQSSYNLGVLLLGQGRIAEALPLLAHAAESHPGRAPSWATYIQALTFNRDFDLARELLDQCHARGLAAPELAAVEGQLYHAWALTLRDFGLGDLAESMFRRSLAAQPSNALGLRDFGLLLEEQGRLEHAKACYRQAAELAPSLALSILANLQVSRIAGSEAVIDQERAAYAEGLAAMRRDPRTVPLRPWEVFCSWYYLPYHGRDDRGLIEETAAVLREKAEGLAYASARLAAWRSPGADGRRTRVAFVSGFFSAHTIGRLYRGLIEHLDRTRFEVVVVHASHAARDDFCDALSLLADQSITLSPDPGRQRAQIEDLAPDVLFYPDIGMAAETYFLAHARLAPVQATSWGHPNTTGLETLDYFVSSALIEPEGAQRLYTERLVQLSRLPCYYESPPAVPEVTRPRAAFDLPPEGRLYGCLQSLFKLHPDFDGVLAAIAAGDPSGHILLLAGRDKVWIELLRARWTASFPILLERVLFMPRIPQQEFVERLAHMDVLLDPVHFGSGNTLYEAMAHGAPIITWPGAFARGRIVQAAYRQMGISDAPVAARIEDYAPLALALGCDAERRRDLGARMRRAAHAHLFADMQAVREVEAFLSAAVDAAAAGEKLPSNWRPS